MENGGVLNTIMHLRVVKKKKRFVDRLSNYCLLEEILQCDGNYTVISLSDGVIG